METIKRLGTTEEITTCDCCGKTGLKKTVALEINEAVVYYGVNCAAAAIYGSKKKASRVAGQMKEFELASGWLKKGFTPEQVAQGIGRRGWSTKVIDGVVNIWIDKTWNPVTL